MFAVNRQHPRRIAGPCSATNYRKRPAPPCSPAAPALPAATAAHVEGRPAKPDTRDHYIARCATVAAMSQRPFPSNLHPMDDDGTSPRSESAVCFILNRADLRPKLGDDGQQRLPVRTHRHRNQPEAVAMLTQNRQRTRSDGASRPKRGNADHRSPYRFDQRNEQSCSRQHRELRINRSSTPPWPGQNWLESFTPACRFSRDSQRSPITAQHPSAIAGDNANRNLHATAPDQGMKTRRRRPQRRSGDATCSRPRGLTGADRCAKFASAKRSPTK